MLRPELLCPLLLQPPILPPTESDKLLFPLGQHNNPVTSNDCLVALALEADHLHWAGAPEMLWEKP